MIEQKKFDSFVTELKKLCKEYQLVIDTGDYFNGIEVRELEGDDLKNLEDELNFNYKF